MTTERNGREWLRTAAPYVVMLAGFAAAGVSIAAAQRVSPVEQRVAALEAREEASREALARIERDVREIRDRMYRWDDDRRRGRFFSPEGALEADKEDQR